MWTCSKCGRQQQKPERRLPMDWKRRPQDDAIFCGQCWREKYIIRAVAVPVASPVDCSWTELDQALKQMWQQTTAAWNWIMTELYVRDVRRTGDGKMPPMNRVYLYPELRSRFPELPPASLAAVEHTVQKKYKALRYELIWMGRATLPNFRYPTPFAVPSQRWSLSLDDEVPIVSVLVAGKRMSLRLKGGVRFRRQLGGLRQIASGQAIKSELALYRRDSQIICKIAAWFQRLEQHGSSGTLTVKTAADSLIVAATETDGKQWSWNGDQIPRWQAEHAKQLQRWAEDRRVQHGAAPFEARRSVAVRKQRRRLENVCHQVSAIIAAYAQRRKLAAVRYDDTERSFCAQFPWFRLKQLVQQKVEQFGIEFVYVGKFVAEPQERSEVEID